MISKPLIQKYIQKYQEDNWNTHNLQSIKSPQKTQTHKVHLNTQTSQPIETPNSLGNWNTQTAKPREALRPLSSLKYSDQIHWNMQLT